MDSTRAARLGLTVALAFYGYRLLLHPGDGSLMDSVDLPIHETGHLVFAPFGDFLQFLGGTLFQLIMPSVFAGYFLLRKDRHAASCMVWWVGQNCWNISVYVRDARAQALPLVGGGEHDWAYLLGEYGWLPYDQKIGHAVWWAGVLLYVLAIGGGLFALIGAPASTEEPVELVAD